MRKITLGLLRDIKCLRRQIFDPESWWAAVAKRSLACPESHDCACKKSLYATSPDFRARRLPYPTPLSHPLVFEPSFALQLLLRFLSYSSFISLC
jgi:hypothetical protein